MNKQNGMVLVVVLLWLVIVTLIVSGLATATREQGMLVRSHAHSDQALHLAQYGLLCAQQDLLSLSVIDCSHATDVHYQITPVFVSTQRNSEFEITVSARSGSSKVVLRELDELLPMGKLKQLWWQQQE